MQITYDIVENYTTIYTDIQGEQILGKLGVFVQVCEQVDIDYVGECGEVVGGRCDVMATL